MHYSHLFTSIHIYSHLFTSIHNKLIVPCCGPPVLSGLQAWEPGTQHSWAWQVLLNFTVPTVPAHQPSKALETWFHNVSHIFACKAMSSSTEWTLCSTLVHFDALCSSCFGGKHWNWKHHETSWNIENGFPLSKMEWNNRASTAYLRGRQLPGQRLWPEELLAVIQTTGAWFPIKDNFHIVSCKNILINLT